MAAKVADAAAPSALRDAIPAPGSNGTIAPHGPNGPIGPIVKTAADLPAAFDHFPPAWRSVLVGFDVAGLVAAIQARSGQAPIGPADPFRALRMVAPEAVRGIVIGQDPYPTPGQADGLSFSAERLAPRPSLRRIFDVLEADRPGWKRPVSGRLDGWAAQGVLMLNTVLTVEIDRIGSHLEVGWQALTRQIVMAATQSAPDVFVMAWGSHAHAFVRDALGDTPAPGLQLLLARHPSNDFKRDFMRDGSHFAATADRVDWWRLGSMKETV